MLLYFFRTSTCFNLPVFLEKFDKTVGDGLPKERNRNFDNISSTKPALCGLGVSSASLFALPAFLASAFEASDFLTTVFLETFDDVPLTGALAKGLSLTNEQDSRLNNSQKNWTQLVNVKTPKNRFLGG